MFLKGQQKNLENIFKNYRASAVYLFGSRSVNKAGPMSDYDFGILLNDQVPNKDYFNIKVVLLSELTKLLKTNDVDLVLLNESPVNICMAVIKGKLIFETKRQDRIQFELKILREYKDREYYEERYQKFLFKSILA